MSTKVRTKTKSAVKSRRCSVSLSADLFDLIEEAALRSGQSVTEFTTTTLERFAQQVIQQETVTVLSNRDRDSFLAMMNDTNAQPNAAFKAAAKRYRKYLGKN